MQALSGNANEEFMPKKLYGSGKGLSKDTVKALERLNGTKSRSSGNCRVAVQSGRDV